MDEEMSNIHGMVLAAGLATRLGPLSDERPKALLPVCNQPLARWAVSLLAGAGIRRISVNLHYLGHQIRQALGDGSDWHVHLSYSEEKEILGTGGGIKAMAALNPGRTCVVINGKLVTDLDLSAVVDYHHSVGGLATMVLYPHPNAEAWGAIGLKNGRIDGILDSRRPGAGRHTNYMFTGIQVLEPEFIAMLGTDHSCVVRQGYCEMLRRDAPLYGYVHRGYFYEHSTPGRYLQGNLKLLRGDGNPASKPGPLLGVDPTAQVSDNAQLISPVLLGPRAVVEDGAVVGPGVVLAADSRVTTGAKVDQSVTWSKTTVSGRISRSIVTQTGKLQVDDDDPMAVPR